MISIMQNIEEWKCSEAIDTLKKCGLKKDMQVLDFGCGALYWTLPAAHIVGEKGCVYAIDRDKYQIEYITDFCKKNMEHNIRPLRLDNTKMSSFKEQVEVILFFDIYHAIGGPTLEKKIQANRELAKEFYRVLKPGGTLAVAVFREVTMVQDAEKGPFTPKGKPKWIYTDYEDGVRRYEIFDVLQSAGFVFAETLENKALHFDEIEKHMDTRNEQSISELERRDIWLFRK